MEDLEYIDIHSHVNFVAYDADREDVISRAKEQEVSIINVGTQHETSESAVLLANKHKNMYATVGLHPAHVGGSIYHDKKELSNKDFFKQNFQWDEPFYKKLAKNKKVVAIGECGLDYFRTESDSKEKQKEIFIAQIHLANELNLPLMLHVRGERGDATPYTDTIKILKKEAKVLGNFHFYAGNLNVATKIWEIGYTTSFTGVITFTNDYNDIVKNAPHDMFMSETDSPYVAPQKYRGRRNEPSYVIEVVKRISEIREENIDSIKNNIAKTAQNLFSL